MTGGWVRPSRCVAGECVEVRAAGDGVQVRDSKHPNQPPLRYDLDHWGRIVDDVKGGMLPFCISSDLTPADDDFVWTHNAGAQLRFTEAEIVAWMEATEDGEFDLDVLAAAEDGAR